MELNLQTWNKETYQNFIKHLHSAADKTYKDFNNRITPNSESNIIGVRVPIMRDYAKNIAKGDAKGFLDIQQSIDKTKLSHEEITIYGLVIGYSKFTYDEACSHIRNYASLVNNWACCDVPVSSFKFLSKSLEEYKSEVDLFLNSVNFWEQRVGVILLLDHYLINENHAKYSLSQINKLQSSEYYVQMAQAWLIATAFAKHRDLTKGFLEDGFALNDEVKKMTIRKLRDSYRISDQDKEWTKTW